MPQCLQGLQHAPGRMTDAGMAAHQAFIDFYDTAELYYAYHLIYTTANQPFKTVDDATLFNAARYPSLSTWSCSGPVLQHILRLYSSSGLIGNADRVYTRMLAQCT